VFAIVSLSEIGVDELNETQQLQVFVEQGAEGVAGEAFEQGEDRLGPLQCQRLGYDTREAAVEEDRRAKGRLTLGTSAIHVAMTVMAVRMSSSAIPFAVAGGAKSHDTRNGSNAE
jgi:hypothetical protein